ncbi:unnamed protein product [Closterium sp. NIES-54]
MRSLRTAQALYDTVVARYSLPATTALGRLLLPYLFPELSAFGTVEDLVLLVALRTRPSLRGAPPPPLPPPTPLLLLSTSLVLRTSGLLLLVPSAAAARARVAGVVAVAVAVVVGAAVEVVEAVEVVAAVGVVAGVGALVAAVEGAVGVAVVASVGVVAVGLELSVEVLEEARGSGSIIGARPHRPSCFSFVWVTVLVRHAGSLTLNTPASPALTTLGAEFGDEAERPHWAELIRSGVAFFDLDYDAILVATYALSASAEGDCYWCVLPDPGIEAAALGASESSLPSTAPAKALHTFTLDSGASRCFFRDSTTVTPLPAPVPVRLGDPSQGPVVARSSTALPCPAVSASGQVAPPCSCHLLSHQTLLLHHRLGHPSLPRLRGMHSRLLVSGLPRSLPPLPPSPAPPYLPCVEGRQRAAPHSSSFPPTTAPLQTLHMDVWELARVNGQDRKRYFVLVVDNYTRYTTVFPLHSKGEVPDVLIPWIRADFCRREGITQSFTLLAYPQQNGIAESRIGLVMEVARTSMIHAAAPHFLWPFAVRYAVHQLNLWPRVSLPETSPTLRWTGKVGDASVFRQGGSWNLCLGAEEMSQGSGDAAEKRNEPPLSKIEALDGSNYEEWSGRMRSAFKRYKLLKLAMGEEKRPEEGDARDRWIEKSAVLYDLILQSVNNGMFQNIKDLVELDDSGPKAWKLLRDVIQPNTLPMVIVLEKELAALSMRPQRIIEGAETRP